MTTLLTKRLQALLSVLSALAVLLVLAGLAGYFLLRGSRPQLDGTRSVAGLSAAVKIERDSLGVPRVTGATRLDVARATGFLHAQERFFQMDLLRRRAAGELAELFGAAAVDVDKSARRHAFRAVAQQALASFPAEDRALLDAYTAGVNAGLAALARQPWEYYVLRTAPVAWRTEDSLLCIYAMWIDLQDDRGHYERLTRAVYDAYGLKGLAFFAPRGTSHDAALDGTIFPEPVLPPLRVKAPAAEEKPTAARDAQPFEPALLPGSNSFAVAGRHTEHGAAILANDMHLGLAVPNVWYRATLSWTDAAGTAHTVSGVTLPGTPTLVAGSNGHIAWGFTNSYADTSDVVVVETDGIADIRYRTPEGWRDIEERTEVIAVKGGDPVSFTVRSTIWGPILTETSEQARLLALRWNAHDASAVDFGLARLETARSAAEAIEAGRRAGMPNNNLLVADTAGRIAWTVTGRLPRRVGYDGRLPVSWAYGDRGWQGWLPPEEIPVLADPEDGVLWTANNRIVGGDAYAKLGDGGYDNGFRAGAIRDHLRDVVQSGRPVTPADVLGVALDDRGRYLERWRGLLLATLTEAAVGDAPARREFRDLVQAWNGRAAVDSAGYRLLRGFRQKTAELTLAPFLERPRARYEAFSFNRFMTEDAVWRLVTEKPERLLGADHVTWDALLLAAVDAVIADARNEGLALRDFTWGKRNTLRMQHPFSRFLPGMLARLLDMPAEPLPGDSSMARVQSRGFGASQRLVVAPGREAEGIFHMPGGQSGHPLSPFYRAGHSAWAKGEPTPLLPGPAVHTLTLTP